VIGRDASRTNHDATVTVVEALFGWTSESDHLIAALAPATIDNVR
jgi:ureidoacrylate peracid hydrolase